MMVMAKGRTAEQAGKSLVWRASQLDDAVRVGGDELDRRAVDEAGALTARVRERWAMKGGRTVVSLAGPTGAGKSTLFNALAEEDVSTIGARRPTTATATAAIWGEEDSDELLDWLAVPTRHYIEGGPNDLDGLVLIDLPDFDSIHHAHHVEADRLLGRSDVFVWVTDPQKYADARLHEDYLSTLADHQSVMMVVLNQIDRVPAQDAVAQLKGDLSTLVAADGAGEFDVLTTSAVIGEGVDELRSRIADVVKSKNAVEQRLIGDIAATSRALLAGVASEEAALTSSSTAELNAALARAAGIPVVLKAVHQDYLRQAKRAAGWPFTRWVARLRPDPLRRLRLGKGSEPSPIPSDDVRSVLGRSSLPSATPAARSQVQLATQRVADAASVGLPAPWVEAVEDAANPDESSLADALDQAVVNTSLSTRDPWWWAAGRGLQLLLALCAVAGVVWLTALAVAGWMQLDLDAPSWGPVPIPLALLLGGVLGGLIVAALAAVLARRGASRRRGVIEKRMTASIDAVATTHVREPVSSVLTRHQQTRKQLQAAAFG